MATVLMWSCSSDTTLRPADSPVSPTPISRQARVLVVTHTEGFSHTSIPVAESTISALGQRSDLGSLLNWIGEGHGFAAMHSAADTYHDAPAYIDMLGNEFLTHGEQAMVDARVETAAHPASSPLGQRFRVFDEIYRFTRSNRGEVTMLLSLDRHPADGLPQAGEPADLPLAWARSYGQGRVFYTALGHREDVWQNVLYQQHILGGIRWVLGL